MTAQELSNRLADLNGKTKCPSYERGVLNGAIDMLRQQAEQIGLEGVALQALAKENIALIKENEALKAALNDAATSLNTISRLAGKEFYVDEDGKRVETYMKHPDQIRGYAQSRYGALIDAMKGAT